MKYDMERYTGICFLMIFLSLLFSSCSKFDDYKKYIEDGEIIYPTKVDSVNVHPGNSRIMFSWVTTDPRIVKYKIFWNMDTDSTEVNVNPSSSNSALDTVRVVISNLEEENYEFSIVSFDEDNNRSVKSFVDGVVYGDHYQSTLLNRVVKHASIDEDTKTLALEWYKADTTEVGAEVIYTNIFNKQVDVYVPRDSIFTPLSDYKQGSAVSFRALYLPDPMAIDTFYTGYSVVEVPQ